MIQFKKFLDFHSESCISNINKDVIFSLFFKFNLKCFHLLLLGVKLFWAKRLIACWSKFVCWLFSPNFLFKLRIEFIIKCYLNQWPWSLTLISDLEITLIWNNFGGLYHHLQTLPTKAFLSKLHMAFIFEYFSLLWKTFYIRIVTWKHILYIVVRNSHVDTVKISCILLNISVNVALSIMVYLTKLLCLK